MPSRPRGRRRRLLQDRARPARRRPVRRGLCAERLQLRPRRKHRRRAQIRPTPTAISAPTATSPGPSRSRPTSYRTSICSAPDELAYIANHYIYTDHAQVLTASAGASYLWNGTRFSADDLWQRPALGLCQHRSRAILHSSQFRPVARFQHCRRRTSRPRCASTSSMCSTRSTRSGTDRASACSRRNLDRVAGSLSAFRRNFKFGPEPGSLIEERTTCGIAARCAGTVASFVSE